jgi:hypothetical protein
MTISFQNSQGLLAIGVQFVNHGQMTCEEAIDQGLQILGLNATMDERILLISDLVGRTSTPPLDNENSHSEWIGDIEFDSTWLDNVDWRHTEALRQYRDTHSPLSENAKNNLEIVTRRIMSNSFNPNVGENEFHWRGLVVGNVQSGKTATYSTLIARAFDSGYKLVIVLSGRLDSLRRQTSSRLNSELVIHAPEGVDVHHLTEVDDSVFAQNSGHYFQLISNQIANNSDCTLIVAKKERTRMRQLNELLIAIRNNHEGFNEFPVLIIDDECDEATIDIGQDDDTSVNHFEIRRLQSNPQDRFISREKTSGTPPVTEEETMECPGFRKTMYIGFTATPYAAVFQEMNDSAEEDESSGLDLYPRDYMLVLDDPPNYCGGEVFLGRYQINDEQALGSLELPEIESLLENLVDLPMNHACNACLAHQIEVDGETLRTHIGNSGYKHFWHTGGRTNPVNASQYCNCACHQTDHSHLIKNPFTDSINHFQPELVPSLIDAIDDFILAGASRLQRNQGDQPTSMMILISHNSYQHFRIRDLMAQRIETIRESWPGLGHRNRLMNRWNSSFQGNVVMVNEGFELIGGGNNTEVQNRVFSPRPIAYSCEFDDISTHIPNFLHNLQHIVLNSGASVSSEIGDNLDFDDDGNPVVNGIGYPGLKAIYYGGFSLGRGLTLKGLTTTYVMRLPGDGSVATQIQRWCGYRMRPGEDILDLSKVYMPPVLSMNYRELLTVERINRFRLGLHSQATPPNRPESVFHYLREPANGWGLVSAAKEGRMETVINPLAGREKTETTFRFTTNGNESIANNWNITNIFLQNHFNQQNAMSEEIQSGILLREVPFQYISNLIGEWSSAPHSQSGYNLTQLNNYIQALVQNDELTSWSVFFPSRTTEHGVPMRNFYDGNVDRTPLNDYQGFNFSQIIPFTRVVNGRRPTTLGPTFRIGTVTSPAWRTIDLQDNPIRRPLDSEPLLIITPIIHPFNRQSPFSTNFNGEIDPIIQNSAEQWPVVPSLSFVFPESNTITGTELGHDQFNQN